MNAKTLIFSGMLVLMTGCATTQPKAEWRWVDGGWVKSPEPAPASQSWWMGQECKRVDGILASAGCWSIWTIGEAGKFYNEGVAPTVDALGKIK